MKFNFFDGVFSPSDIAERIDTLFPYKKGRDKNQPGFFDIHRIYGAAYIGDGEERKCRAFLWEGGNLYTTALVNPNFPGSRVNEQFRVLEKEGSKATSNKAREQLTTQELHKEFYEEISDWFKRIDNPSSNELSHLIRILFAYLLQSRKVLKFPLWDKFQEEVKDKGKDVHQRITRLFTKILAVEPDLRDLSKFSADDRALIKKTPFLNGSLFTNLPEEQQPKPLDNALYIVTDPGKKPGLLNILDRYDWTLSEPTSSATESALDPSLMGNLFERLMLSVEGAQIGTGGKKRMPGGSYYTPNDIADEMATDAIVHWLSKRIKGVDIAALRALTHPTPREKVWSEWSKKIQQTILKKLQTITVLDPCCGSGAFTVAMLQALYRAESRLIAPETANMESIIEKQLYAVDKHPIAVLITRLRLFIALTEWRLKKREERERIKPLPNLETRCVAADSLQVECERKGSLLLGEKEWNDAIEKLRKAREEWITAYSAERKKSVLEKEHKARKYLLKLTSWQSDSLDKDWLEVDLLSPSPKPIAIDLRKLLIPEEGWDIVIGNPPYQDSSDEDREKVEKLGYNTYKGNLYTHFTEMALEVTKPDGCITFIVPHSIVFRINKPYFELRKKIEMLSDSIDIRTYDNNPSVFPPLPWLKSDSKSKGNHQRATVIVVCKGESGSPLITSRGLIRLNKGDRVAILRSPNLGQPQPPYSKQWTQAPTPATVELLKAMRTEKPALAVLGKKMDVIFPLTARYYISCLPEGVIDVVSRKLYSLPDGDLGWAWLGLYNSHLFHAYWLIVGDAFHMTKKDWINILPPKGWQNQGILKKTARLARKLCNRSILSDCREDYRGKDGKIFPNVNFHQPPAEKIIAELDSLLISAYGLEEQPLLKQIRTMRTGSAHQLIQPPNTD